MQDDQLKSESRPVVSRPRSGPLDGMEPAVYDTVSHAARDVSSPLAEEAQIRQHERALCAVEVLLAADKLGWEASPAAISQYVMDRTVDTRVTR